MKHFLCISGWGINPENLQKCIQAHFPQYRFTCVAPIPNSQKLLKSNYEGYIAYSFGATFLLNFLHNISTKNPKIYLIAPFINIVPSIKTKIYWMKKQLLQNPLTCLTQFYQLTQLNEPLTQLPYSLENLLWGLSFMQSTTTNTSSLIHQLLYSENDPLLQENNFHPHSFQAIHQNNISSASHNYTTLIPHLKLEDSHHGTL